MRDKHHAASAAVAGLTALSVGNNQSQTVAGLTTLPSMFNMIRLTVADLCALRPMSCLSLPESVLQTCMEIFPQYFHGYP